MQSNVIWDTDSRNINPQDLLGYCATLYGHEKEDKVCLIMVILPDEPFLMAINPTQDNKTEEILLKAFSKHNVKLYPSTKINLTSQVSDFLTHFHFQDSLNGDIVQVDFWEIYSNKCVYYNTEIYQFSQEGYQFLHK